MSTQKQSREELKLKRLQQKRLRDAAIQRIKAEQPEFTQLEYAKQALAALFLFAMWSIFPVMAILLPIWLIFFSPYWYVMALYTIWFVYDYRTPLMGGRHLKVLREWSLWKHLTDYYPIGLVKTVDLEPDRNYILGSHPHGFWCTGVFTHMLTDGTNFRTQFPGLKPYLLTLNGQFWFPFRRDFGINLGGVMSCAESLEYLLSTQDKGRIVGIVIGGSTEVLEAHVGRHMTCLKTRRGFCKYAFKYGAWLVPSYSFGENDIFIQIPNKKGSLLRKIQDSIKRRIGFCPPLYFGRGLFNGFFGLLPFRRPITMVVGSPIEVQKCEHPTQEQIDKLHETYVQALVELFDKHKEQYGVPKEKELLIL